MKPTILLTGATGYLGRRLVPRLVDSGYRIFILKRPRSNLANLGRAASSLRIFDIETDGLLAPFLQPERIDTVIHLATCYGKSGESSAEILETNFETPASLLEAAIKHGTGNFINADTYFNLLSRGAPCLDNYSLSKGLFQTWGFQRAEESGLRFVNLRLEHLYGPSDSPQKFVNWLVKTLLTNPPRLELTAGKQERDFIFIDDVIDALDLIISHLPDLPGGPQEIGVGSGKTTSIHDFVELSHTLCSSTTELVFGALPVRKHEIMKSQADLTLLTSLGWQARVDLASGLQQVISHERRNLDSRDNAPCMS